MGVGGFLHSFPASGSEFRREVEKGEQITAGSSFIHSADGF